MSCGGGVLEAAIFLGAGENVPGVKRVGARGQGGVQCINGGARTLAWTLRMCVELKKWGTSTLSYGCASEIEKVGDEHCQLWLCRECDLFHICQGVWKRGDGGSSGWQGTRWHAAATVTSRVPPTMRRKSRSK